MKLVASSSMIAAAFSDAKSGYQFMSLAICPMLSIPNHSRTTRASRAGAPEGAGQQTAGLRLELCPASTASPSARRW